MTNIANIFAHNLKEKRQKYGLTQAKLAEKVGVSTHHIAMIEIARHYPTLELVERIANTLEIEIYELFLVEPSPENAMERLHNSLVCNIEKVITETIDKNINLKFKGTAPESDTVT
jgi:transcriptional regulator with XRE-family HTH domain